jgi:hypothetical protein
VEKVSGERKEWEAWGMHVHASQKAYTSQGQRREAQKIADHDGNVGIDRGVVEGYKVRDITGDAEEGEKSDKAPAGCGRFPPASGPDDEGAEEGGDEEDDLEDSYAGAV